MTTPASQIAVKAFHHTLLWPVLMRGPAGFKEEADQNIDAFVTAFESSGWVEQVGESNGVHRDHTYSEVVYFHPFVRDFLFGDGLTTKDKRAVRRFTRSDVTGLKVVIKPKEDSDDGKFELELKVERAELLLLRPRVAILLVEVSNRDLQAKFVSGQDPTVTDARTPLTLDQVLLLQSRLRHIYPPYFEGTAHGDCPAEVKWQGLPESTEVEKYTPDTPLGTFDAFTRVGAEPPVYDHWRQWFGCGVKPLRSANDRAAGGLLLQQLLDDRMPGLSFLAVSNPEAIDPTDLDCLPAFDPPGLIYDPAFNAALRGGFQYLRFRHYGTTFYGDGTSFAVVCNTTPFSETLLGHFRRHYTHLAVIAHFQHAALLYFADELAETAKMLANRKTESEFSDEGWRYRIRVIQHRFLKFRARGYFTEVSNQVQGKDLFAFWLRHLGTAALFDRVAATNSQVYDALESFEAHQMSDAQVWLGKIAGFGGAVSLALSVTAFVFAIAGLYDNPEREAVVFGGTTDVPSWLAFWLILAAVPGVLVGLGFGLFCWFGLRKTKNPKPARTKNL